MFCGGPQESRPRNSWSTPDSRCCPELEGVWRCEARSGVAWPVAPLAKAQGMAVRCCASTPSPRRVGYWAVRACTWARGGKSVGILAFAAVLVTGVAVFILAEGWDFVLSLYVTAQIVMSVGYGDHVPSSEGTRLFVAFYSLVSFACFTYYCSLLTVGAFHVECSTFLRHLKHVGGQLDPSAPKSPLPLRCYGAPTLLVASGCFAAAIIIGMLFFAAFEGKDEGVTFAQGFYLSVTTLSTTGFRDFTPRSKGGQLFCAVWMVAGVAAAVHWVALLASWLLQRRRLEQFRAAEVQGDRSKRFFTKLDGYQRGSLSRGEFMTYTLLKYGLVEESLVAQIDVLYERLVLRSRNNNASLNVGEALAAVEDTPRSQGSQQVRQAK